MKNWLKNDWLIDFWSNSESDDELGVCVCVCVNVSFVGVEVG